METSTNSDMLSLIDIEVGSTVYTRTGDTFVYIGRGGLLQDKYLLANGRGMVSATEEGKILDSDNYVRKIESVESDRIMRLRAEVQDLDEKWNKANLEILRLEGEVKDLERKSAPNLSVVHTNPLTSDRESVRGLFIQIMELRAQNRMMKEILESR